MTRLIRICLLLATLGGLIGQSTAMAMAPAPTSPGSLQTAMAGMDCKTMADVPAPEKAPCKNMTLQCMAAMGCVSLALVEPDSPAFDQPSAGHLKATLPVAARLWGRSYGPEPDPPSFLI